MSSIPLLPRRVAAFLLLSDLVGLLVCFNIANVLRLGSLLGMPIDILLPMGIMVLVMYVFDCYAADNQVNGMRPAPRALVAVLAASVVTAAGVYAFGLWGEGNSAVGRGVLALAHMQFALWASASRYFVAGYQTAQTGNVRWLVLGAGDKAARLYRDFRKSSAGVQGEMCCLTDGQEETEHDLPPMIGSISSLDKVLGDDWTGVIVAPTNPLSDSLVQQLMAARFAGMRVYDLADFYEQLWFKVPVLHTQRGWLLFAHGFELLHNALALRVKRLLDIVVSFVLLCLTLPLLALTALAVKVDSRGPVLFRQVRTGLKGREFEILKFRSMVTDAEKDGPQWAAARDPRVTRVGRIIRALRLDELPQLINVIRGEMSFIGPRPERPVFNRELEKQIPFYELRHLVRPGITGWAQVMYDYGASADDALEKLQYDLYYIKNYSLLLDLAILLKTLRVVMFVRGR